MKRIAGKLKNTSGFSLFETLLAVLLIGMMCVIVGGGTITVKNAYDRMVKKENAVTLCSTIEIKLDSELRSAEYRDTLSDGTIVYVSHTPGSYGGMVVGLTQDPLDNIIKMHFYTKDGDAWKDMSELSGDKKQDPVPILPVDTFTDGLKADLTLTHDEGAGTYYFKVEIVNGDSSDATVLADVERTVKPKY
ncbi:MAG: hypothetical protein K6E33_07305 [Lachnospiraceae bacterium]|nr:hypothetical protein [Lachnospiraceae bacterium]